jgi:hypothetical protein
MPISPTNSATATGTATTRALQMASSGKAKTRVFKPREAPSYLHCSQTPFPGVCTTTLWGHAGVSWWIFCKRAYQQVTRTAENYPARRSHRWRRHKACTGRCALRLLKTTPLFPLLGDFTVRHRASLSVALTKSTGKTRLLTRC